MSGRPVFAVAVAAALMAHAPREARAWERDAPPVAHVSVTVFYDALAPWGRWVEIPPYGWCWEPDLVAADWRPYEDGAWVYTDLGWTWVSGEPWGWAVYHYGRWVDDPVEGWLWVPGTEWGPAWVVWREDPEWIGWAPLPPETGWSAWFTSRTADDSRIAARAWCFTRAQDFVRARGRERVEPVGHNPALIGRTRDATRYERRDGRPFDRGIDPADLERRTGARVPRLGIRDADAPGRAGRAADGAVAFYRPLVERARPGEAPPRTASRRGGREMALGRPSPSNADRGPAERPNPAVGRQSGPASHPEWGPGARDRRESPERPWSVGAGRPEGRVRPQPLDRGRDGFEHRGAAPGAPHFRRAPGRGSGPGAAPGWGAARGREPGAPREPRRPPDERRRRGAGRGHR